MRANLISAGCFLSAHRGSKEFAKVLFDTSAHKTGWKLILSKNVGNLLNVVVEINPCVLDFKCPVLKRSY